MTRYVVGLAFDDKFEKVALIQKNRPEWQRDKLNGIGGKIENTDHTPFEAMVREFEEETGVKTNIKDWNNFLRMNGSDWMLYFFRMFNCDLSKLKSVTDEEIIIIELDKIEDYNIIYNLNWLIPMALDKDIHFGIVN